MISVSIAASGGHLTADTVDFGRAGDHLATTVTVTLAEDLRGVGYAYRLLFETADGFRCMTERLTPSADHQLSYALPSALMVEGSLQMQLLVYAGETVIAHTPLCEPLPQIAPSLSPDSAVPAEYDGLVLPGVGISGAAIINRHLYITFQDETTQDAGEVTPDFSSLILSLETARDNTVSATQGALLAKDAANLAAVSAARATALVNGAIAESQTATAATEAAIASAAASATAASSAADAATEAADAATEAAEAATDASDTALSSAAAADTAATAAGEATEEAAEATETALAAATAATTAAASVTDAIADIPEQVEEAVEARMVHAPTSWAEVQEILHNGLGRQTFHIGDEFVCNHSVFGQLIWRVIGIDCEQLANPQSNPQQHNLTLQLRHCLPNPMPIDENNVNEWGDCQARIWLNTTFFNALDQDMRAVIKMVKKQTVKRTGTTSFALRTTEDKVFLPSRSEVYAGKEQLIEGAPYPYYEQGVTAVEGGADISRSQYMKEGIASLVPVSWWLRSPEAYSDFAMRQVNTAGNVEARSACNTETYLLPIVVIA